MTKFLLCTSALSYLTTPTLGAADGDMELLFILDNRMMMFLNQNCLLFHVISSIPNDIDYIVFKIIDKDCITIYERLDTSNDNYDRNTTHSPYT